jgi:hypothetical protein
LAVELGGLLRKVRAQDAAEIGANAPPKDATSAYQTPAADPAPPVTNLPTGAPPSQRRTWASGAFLAAAARLVARGEETTYTLRRVVEWATAATGCPARDPLGDRGRYRATIDDIGLGRDRWVAARRSIRTAPQRVAVLLRAIRSPTTVLIEMNRPMEQAVSWGDIIGVEPIAICAAISGGEPRGILAVAGIPPGSEATTFGEDARAALAACAALAAIVFERRKEDGVSAGTTPAPAEPTNRRGGDRDTAGRGDGPTAADRSCACRIARRCWRAARGDRARAPIRPPVCPAHLDADRVEEWVGHVGAGAIPTLLSPSGRGCQGLGTRC